MSTAYEQVLAPSEQHYRTLKDALEVAARLVSDAPSGDVSAVIVVIDVVEPDVRRSLFTFAKDVAAAYRLHTRVRRTDGSFCVRFTREQEVSPLRLVPC